MSSKRESDTPASPLLKHTYVTVAMFDNPHEAHLAKNRLEAAGIRAFLANQDLASMFWHMTNAIGGVRLQVEEGDLARASAVLEEDVALDPDARSLDDLATEEQQLVDEVSHPLPTPADFADPPEPELSRREQNADRALKAAILGLLMAPLQFYAFWLVLCVFVSDEPLARSHRRNAMIAAAICIPMVMVITSVGLTFGIAIGFETLFPARPPLM